MTMQTRGQSSSTPAPSQQETAQPTPETTADEQPEKDDDSIHDSDSDISSVTPQNTTTKEPEVIFISNHWDGNLPHPVGNIAQEMDISSIREQQCRVQELSDKLQNNSWNAETLQANCYPYTFLIAIPNSTRKVRVAYGLGNINEDELGFEESPLLDKVLVMFGEKHEHAEPEVLVLPRTLLQPKEMHILGRSQMETERLKTSTTKMVRPTFGKAMKGDKAVDIARIVPIPPYLVYDAIDKDIDAVVVYERIMNSTLAQDCWCRPAHEKALQFLRAIVTGPNSKDKPIFLPSELFCTRCHPDAFAWRSQRLPTLFPELYLDTEPRQEVHTGPRTAPTTPPLPPAPAARTPDSGAITITEEALLRIINSIQGNKSKGTAEDDTASTASTKSDSTTKDFLGLNELVYNKLLLMCGLTVSEKDDIPSMWPQIRSKTLSKNDKSDIIRETFSGKLKYRGCRIPLLPSLITMFRDRTFEGDATSSSLVAATKGLSPFAVPSLSEAELDFITDHAGAVAAASSTTVADINASKIKAKAPETFTGCIKQLKTYGNVLHCGFGDLCPLFLALDKVIESLENFLDVERSTYDKRTFASILWIVMLQSRYFARGKMHSPTDLLPEFQMLINNVCTRIPVVHGGVRSTLYEASSTTTQGGGIGTGRGHNGGGNLKRELDNEAGAEGKNDKKKRRTKTGVLLRGHEVERADIYHKDMQEAMAPFVRMEPRPTVKQLCQTCNASASQLFPQHPKLCIRAQLFGICDKRCNNEHKKVNEDTIKQALTVLQPAITNPTSVKTYQKV